LHRQQSLIVDHISETHTGRSDDPHREREWVPGRTKELCHALPVDREHPLADVGCGREEAVEEEEEGFTRGVVERPAEVRPVDEDGFDPVERRGEVVTASVAMEEGENVSADNRVCDIVALMS
jgi:hypothetical protein